MSYLRVLATAALALTLTAPAQAEGGTVTIEKDRFIDFYLVLKDHLSRMPGLRGDGVTLSRAYLLDKLRERFNKEGVEVRDLDVDVWPSGANFVLFRPRSRDGDGVWQGLVDRSVLVRNCASWPRLDGCLRVTIGTPDEDDRFLDALEEVL